MNHEHYMYKVIWSPEDKEYVGLCAELPSLSVLDKTQGKALSGITKLVGSVVQDMRNNGEDIPEPLSEKHYSGKFMVRTTPERHRLIAMQARELGVSLNRLVNDRLAT